MAKGSDIIKIGFDYRASLEQFEKETNGVFDGISAKAGKQRISIQLDAKNDKVIEKIKELQKLKLDKFTFEFGESGLAEQLKTFDQLEKKINEIINLSKGITSAIPKADFGTKNKTEAYNQLKQMADIFKNFYGNEEAMHSKAGTDAAYAYYKAYEEALKKGVAESKLQKVTVDVDPTDSFFTAEKLVYDRMQQYDSKLHYGGTTDLSEELLSLESRLSKFDEAYSKVRTNLGNAPITPEILKNIEEYVRYLEIAEAREKDRDTIGFSQDDIDSMKDMANMNLGFAMTDAIEENKKYVSSLDEVREEKEKTDEVLNHSSTSSINDSQFDELKADVVEIREELNGVKEKISVIDSDGFENIKSDVEKTTESVKELNSELTELKSKVGDKSNISSGNHLSKSVPTYEQVYEILNKIAIAYDGVTKNTNEAQAVVNKLGDKISPKSFEEELIGLGNGINKETIATKKLSLKKGGSSETITKEIDASNKLKEVLSSVAVTYGNFENVLNTVCSILGVEIPQNANKAAQTIQQLGNQISSNDSWKNGLNDDEIRAVNKALDDMRNNISSSYSKDNMLTDLVDTLNYIKTLNPNEFVSYIETLSNGYQNFINTVTHYRETNQQTLNGEKVEDNWKFNFEQYLKGIKSVTQAEQKLGEVRNASSSNSTIKDVFQNEKVEQATTSAKELDKTLEQVNIPTDSFDDVLSKLDLAKSKLTEIVKITRQARADKDGKFHDSYTLKDSRGSTEIYGLSSNTEKGQLLRSNIVQYDVKDEEQEKKALLEVEKQITEETKKQNAEQQKKWDNFQKENAEENKKAYQELTDTIQQYSEVSKRIANGKALDGDIELAQKLEDKISTLQKQPILSSSQIDESERKLEKLLNQLDAIEKKQVNKAAEQEAKTVEKNNKAYEKQIEKAKKLSEVNKNRQVKEQQSSVNSALKQQESAWKNIQSIREKIAKPDSKDEDYISLLKETKIEYQKQYIEAGKVLKANQDIYDSEKQVNKLKQIQLETDAKISKYKASQKTSTVSSFQSSIDSYQSKYNQYNNRPAKKQSVEYQNLLKEYENQLDQLKKRFGELSEEEIISEDQIGSFNKLKEQLDATDLKFQNVFKGDDLISVKKEIDTITQYMSKNTGISSEAKDKLRGYIDELKTKGADANVKAIHDAFLDVCIAERKAKREGQSFLDVLRDKVWYQWAAQIGSYFSLNDILRYGKQAVETIIELDTALVDLKKTTAMSSSQMEDFYFDANDVAKEMGATTKEIIEQASAWSRLNKIGLLYGDI